MDMMIGIQILAVAITIFVTIFIYHENVSESQKYLGLLSVSVLFQMLSGFSEAVSASDCVKPFE